MLRESRQIWSIMPDEKKTDDVEKVLSEIKSVEDRKQALIADLLRQREAVLQEFDAKLAKLGYKGKARESGRKEAPTRRPWRPEMLVRKPHLRGTAPGN